MKKMIWMLTCGVIVCALMVRTSIAIKCYECNSYENSYCADPFHALVEQATECSDEDTQCVKVKVKTADLNIVMRGCAPPTAETNVCVYDNRDVPDEDGSTVKVKSYVCVCSKDQCNGGELFQPKLLMIAMMIVLVNVFCN